MPKTQTERLWVIGALLVAVVLTVVAYFFGISPKRSDTADVHSQIDAARVQNTTLQTRITALEAQNRKLSTYRAQLKQAELALPTSSGLPDFLRSLQSLGNATLAKVTGLTVGAPALVGGADSSTASASSSTTDQTAPTSDSTTTAPATPTTPQGPQLYALPITAQVSGTVAQLTDFLGQLQSVQPRAVLVSSINLGSAGSSGTTLDLAMNAFVAPDSAAETEQLAQAAGQ